MLTSYLIKMMNPIEAAGETSKSKHQVRRCSSTGVSQICSSSSVVIRDRDRDRDQYITSSLYTDKAMIKYVIGASNILEQQSILKKSANNQISTTTAAIAESQQITPSNIISSKAVARPDANSTVKVQQQSVTSTTIQQSECKQQNTISSSGQSLIKLPTVRGLSEKSSYSSVIKRTLPTLQHKQSVPRPIAAQATLNSLNIYKTKNGHPATDYSEMIASSYLSRSSELPTRKLPISKDVQKSTAKRYEREPVNINRIRKNSEPEVTQISSTVTLTKAPITTSKLNKTLPSPFVTIEKKGNTPSSNIFNCSKQGKILFPNSAEPMDIVVNTIGDSKMISLGNDTSEPISDISQKSLLLKQTSPTNLEKTPPKLVAIKPKQQSLLKVNSLARLLHTSPRTKRSKSLTVIGNVTKKRRRMLTKGRRLSTASDGELLKSSIVDKSLTDPLEIREEKPTPASQAVRKTSVSLLCNEKIESVPSSSSNSSLEITPKKEILPKNELAHATDISASYINSFQMNSVLEMLSAFNMLMWKDRIGTFKNSKIKFHLNEFNLLQVAEKCPPRERIHTAYEKPIYERESSSNTSDYSDPLYLCRRCNCHGAAVDFLAPEFCSYDCFKRDSRKRSKTNISSSEKITKDRHKKSRKSLGTDINECFVNRAGIDAALERFVHKRAFTWVSYLSSNKFEAAPIDLFLNPFPCGANLFEIGMKLEAIDPEHNSLFCVCTVIEKKGYRLKLKFDGYSKIHNFWVNADSMDIFPPGWCAKTNRVLQPPKSMNLLTFNWPNYLNKTKSTPAPRSLFTHLNSSSSTNPFKSGMRLEAEDLKNTGKICVATIADVLDNRVLIHFDGWDESYDYWIDINSPYIHPIGWHQENSLELVPPPDWDEFFSWPEYLNFTQSKAALPRMFSRRYPIEFCTGMKLEVVDVKNPCLIRPATVICRNECKVLIHLDGWPSEFTFWVNDDSPDIHPIGWSDETGHDLEPPPGYDRPPANMPCPVNGCRGIGNAKRIDINFHANEDTCPYTVKNWDVELEIPSRLDEVGRFVYTGDTSSNQRKSLSDRSVIDISSDEQPTCVTPETDVKKPITAQQKPTTAELKPILLPATNDTAQVLPSITEEVKLAREYLCDYGPRLRQNYIIWQENSNFIPEMIKKNPLQWTTKETADYISAKCHPIGQLFQREDIDGIALLNMHQSDLTDILKIKLGPAIKIYTHILHLRNEVVSRFSDIKPSTDI